MVVRMMNTLLNKTSKKLEIIQEKRESDEEKNPTWWEKVVTTKFKTDLGNDDQTHTHQNQNLAKKIWYTS